MWVKDQVRELLEAIRDIGSKTDEGNFVVKMETLMQGKNAFVLKGILRRAKRFAFLHISFSLNVMHPNLCVTPMYVPMLLHHRKGLVDFPLDAFSRGRADAQIKLLEANSTTWSNKYLTPM